MFDLALYDLLLLRHIIQIDPIMLVYYPNMEYQVKLRSRDINDDKQAINSRLSKADIDIRL